MEIKTINTTVLKAEEGNFLTQNDATLDTTQRVVTKEVYLGAGSDPDYWVEISAEQAASLEAEIKAAIEKATAEADADLRDADSGDSAVNPGDSAENPGDSAENPVSNEPDDTTNSGDIVQDADSETTADAAEPVVLDDDDTDTAERETVKATTTVYSSGPSETHLATDPGWEEE